MAWRKSSSVSQFPAVRLPIPPALDTAAHSFGLHKYIIAPQMMGYWIPNISVIPVLNMRFSPFFYWPVSWPAKGSFHFSGHYRNPIQGLKKGEPDRALNKENIISFPGETIESPLTKEQSLGAGFQVRKRSIYCS